MGQRVGAGQGMARKRQAATWYAGEVKRLRERVSAKRTTSCSGGAGSGSPGLIGLSGRRSCGESIRLLDGCEVYTFIHPYTTS